MNLSDWKNYSTLGIILGSGLNECIPEVMDIEGEIAYKDIEGMKLSTAPGHVGKFLFGKIDGQPIVAMQGRLHFYEGYEMRDVVKPIQILHALGVQSLIVTNAAGGINLEYAVGDFMLIADHINFMGTNPLIGPKQEGFERFPDMSYTYDRTYIDTFKKIADEISVRVHEGVYLGTTGPSYETPAEIRAFRVLGADAVGMSTVPEVICARQMGMRICGISLISNMAAGVLDQKLSEKEVLETGERMKPQFQKMITAFISRYGDMTR
ncbi:MAG: purine-nucleoside phosphorylase [Peptococcaceae bacterium]|nr:purine-nucleoside phosphorylase [Peptococcaceae bacterium]